ncbi:MAG TPA: glycosyltransferase family 39 protein, partial [Halothiobacillaceae bacterium]|nr:glycosyltransferase family 39 protein [Halothiobacillaceae bacterium]
METTRETTRDLDRMLDWGWLPLFLLLVAVSLLIRPLMPVDETRYLGVAWEMWQSGSWVVPLLNGEPYSHKPPLLFWLIHAGWAVFGVNEITPRLVAPGFALGSLFLVRAIAARMVPQRPLVSRLTPWILAGTIYWAGFATLTLFDQLVVFFVLLGVFGLLELGRGWRRGWLWLFLGTALGALAKGPFALIYLVPLTVAAPWWAGVSLSWRWFAKAGTVGFLGSAVALGWALWAASLGGPAYAEAILWGQVAGRTVHAFAHAQPLYYYLWVLPLLFLPWTLMLPLIWRRSIEWPEPYKGRLTAMLLAWVGFPCFVLSLASGKLPHYLLPMLPALALATAVGLANRDDHSLRGWPAAILWLALGLAVVMLPWVGGSALMDMLPAWVSLLGLALVVLAVWPGWLWVARSLVRRVIIITATTMVGLLLLQLALAPLRPAFDAGAFATRLGDWQRAGHSIAFVGKYRDEYNFTGRLVRPLVVLSDDEGSV